MSIATTLTADLTATENEFVQAVADQHRANIEKTRAMKRGDLTAASAHLDAASKAAGKAWSIACSLRFDRERERHLVCIAKHIANPLG